MLTALVLHPPRFGATVASVDDQAALAEPGVVAVVPIEEGVAVVAETVADAQRGLRALVVDWDDSERRATELRRAARRAPPVARIGRAGRGRAGRRQRRDGARRRADGRRRDVHAAIPGARDDGAEQRGVPDARGRGARGLGEHRVARVHADVGLGSRRHRQGAGRGTCHLRRGIVRAPQQLRARPHDRGRTRRPRARLEAPDQGPVAPRGGLQDRPLPRDGRPSSPRRSRCARVT